MFKKFLMLLMLISLSSNVIAYMIKNNDVFLTILIDSGKKVELDVEGSSYFNGKEYTTHKISVNYIQDDKVKVTIGNKAFTGKAHLMELTIPSSFSKKGNKKQSFSGDIHIRTYKNKIVLLNIMNLESYTRYVVSNEIGSGAPEEALKAQAIISRTYAIYNSMKNVSYPWDLRADTYSQVFNTKKDIPQKVIDACNATEYSIITHNDKPAFTPFSGYNGGYIANVEDVWGGKGFPYLSAKGDNSKVNTKDMTKDSNLKRWIKTSPEKAYKHYSKLPNWLKASFQWKKKVNLTTVANRGNYSKVRSLSVVSRDKSGRVNNLRVVTSKGWENVTSQDKIRRILGVTSTMFYLEKHSGYVIVKGKGNGHGVGFCQTGGYLKAYAGWNYKKIIKHYYPQTDLNDSFFFDKSTEDELEKLFSD